MLLLLGLGSLSCQVQDSVGDGPAPELWGSDGVIAAPEGVQAWIREHAAREIA